MRDYSFTVEILRSCAEDNCETCPIGGAKYTSKDCRKAHNDAADAIEELLSAVPKWISVEERLPEENKNYLCYGVFLPLGVKAMDMYRFDGVRWRTSSDVEITHWMPLPEPPQEVK